MSATQRDEPFSRRDFLHLVTALGGASAFSAFMAACSQAGFDPTFEPLRVTTQEDPSSTSTTQPTPTITQQGAEITEATTTPTEIPPQETAFGTAKVAFVKTTDRATGVRQAIELLGFPSFAGRSIFVKPNLNSADPAPGSTHPDVLHTIVSMLQEKGAFTITVGDRSGMGNTRSVMDQIGIFELAEQMGFNTVVFDELEAEDWILTQPHKSHWKNGFLVARPCLEPDMLIQACCLKTHRFGGHFTMSLKNSVGLVAKRNPENNYDYMQELHSSPHQRRMIAEINTAYSPDLIVLDGVEAFTSGGPDYGTRVSSQVVLAGTDRIAIDAVGVALLRYHGCQTEVAKGKIFQQDQIKTAVQLGLGVESPDKIQLITPDSESEFYAHEIQEILFA